MSRKRAQGDNCLNIVSVPVKFPYERPYTQQTEYMIKVMRALKKGKNAMLESPTGSGKSLALICSTLAWAQLQEPQPQIVMCSRTHSQLQQLVDETKQSSYSPVSVVLASREHYCINPDINSQQDVTKACNELNTTPEKCSFLKNFKSLAARVSHAKLGDQIVDIEDLVTKGKQMKACPYYASKYVANKSAEILFVPYDYIFTPLPGRQMDTVKAGSILVVDEAHNIASICRNSASVRFHKASLTSLYNVTVDSHFPVARIVSGLLSLLGTCDTDCGFFPILAKVLEDAGVSFGSSSSIVPMVERLRNANAFGDHIIVLDELWKLLKFFPVAHSESYRFIVDKSELTIIALDPSGVFKECSQSARSIIMTSGTLSPMNFLCTILDTEFKYQYECSNHVISEERVFPVFMGCTPNGTTMKANSENFDDPVFKEQLGYLIINLVKHVTDGGGILLFLPSYRVLDELRVFWRSKTIWKKLSAETCIVIEPRSSAEFPATLSTFFDSVQTPAGERRTLFIAVYRGKVSEGMNFSDEYTRMVITVGLPFPNCNDPGIKLTRQYLNNRFSRQGDNWYFSLGYQALNQALGRCIRHSQDYGALVIIDSRFRLASEKIVSKWISRLTPMHVSDPGSFLHFSKKLSEFYAKLKPVAKPTRWAVLPQFGRLDLCHNLYTLRSAPTGVCMAPI